jgi:hypothetical protein
MNFLYLIAGFLFPGATFLLKRDYFRGFWFLIFTALPFVLGVVLLKSANPASPGFLNWFRALLSAPIDASGAVSYVILNLLKLIFILYPLVVTPGLFILGILFDYVGIAGFGLEGTHYREIATCFCICSALLNILVILKSYDFLMGKETT